MTTQNPLPRRRLLIALDRPGGDTPLVSVLLPDGAAVFPDILPAVRAVADTLQDEARRTVAELGQAVTCHLGCDACCRHLVVLGEAEALALLRTLRGLPEPRRQQVLARFQAGLARLESADLLPRLFAVFTREAHDWRHVAEMLAAYWELAIPCPFLEDKACGIYDERPLTCRQYAMTSPPAACLDPFGPQASLVKVLPPVDLAGAAAAFDGEQAHASRVLPLLLCLLLEPRLGRHGFPILEPLPMLDRFLKFAAGHYSRKDPPPNPQAKEYP